MGRKEIQENRMKGYFIESCMSMIRGEGIKSISVRSVSDNAGYSYATLYNYFKDLRELLFHCIKEFLKECQEQISKKKHPKEEGWERFKSLSKSYVNYFVQYPGIFELIFVEQMREVAVSELLSNEVDTFFNEVFSSGYQFAISNDRNDIQNISALKNVHISILNGMLSLYLLKRSNWGYKDFITDFDSALDFALKEYFI